jgi:hypothetical protein
MAEMDSGHPDELVQVLRNWLRQSESPTGTLLPEGIDPLEWAIRQFINYWKRPARQSIESIEQNLKRASALCNSKSPQNEINFEILVALSTLQEDLRDHLGLYEWNKE